MRDRAETVCEVSRIFMAEYLQVMRTNSFK
jgi:hypothetical protein